MTAERELPTIPMRGNARSVRAAVPPSRDRAQGSLAMTRARSKSPGADGTRRAEPADASNSRRRHATTPRKFRWLAPLSLAASIGVASAACAEDAASPVKLQLVWRHQAQFGGFYVADQKGLYAQERIKISLLEGGPDVAVVDLMLSGGAQFGIADATDVLVSRAAGKPIRAIASVFRRSPIVYISKIDSGIRRPHDFVGKSIRSSNNVKIQFLALMGRIGIAPDKYRLVEAPYTAAAFESGAADVWANYINGFPTTLEAAGYKFNRIYPDDYGVHFYSDMIVTTDTTIATSTDLVLRFLRASLKGWAEAVEDPKLVGAIVGRYNPAADAALETRKMRATQPLVNTGEDQIGWMNEEVWAGMLKELRAQSIVAAPVDLNDVYTMKFLQEIYRKAR